MIKKATVDEVLILLAIREFISSCNADQIAKIAGDFLGVSCTPSLSVENAYDIQTNEHYTGILKDVFNDIE